MTCSLKYVKESNLLKAIQLTSNNITNSPSESAHCKYEGAQIDLLSYIDSNTSRFGNQKVT